MYPIAKVLASFNLLWAVISGNSEGIGPFSLSIYYSESNLFAWFLSKNAKK